MGNEILIPEMPQLRKMVLENTARIIKNEQTIREMEKKLLEEGEKQRQRETYWDTSREEHDRAHREHEQDMRKLREFMFNHAVQFEADLKKSREEFNQRQAELDVKAEERHRKFDEDLKKSRDQFNEDLKKSREQFDEDLKKSREQFDEDLKKSREQFDEDLKKSQEQFDEDLKKSQEQFKEDLKESRKKFEEDLKQSREEFNKDLKESRREFDNRMKALDNKISKLTTDFIGTIGHIVEGLAGTKAEKMFTEQGYEISDKKRNVHRKIKILNKEMEADVVLLGKSLAIVIEVKANCTRKNIDEFMNHMTNHFRDLFPEWNSLEILGAVAAINYEDDADAYAHENGLLVIRTDSQNVFTLDKSDRDSLTRF